MSNRMLLADSRNCDHHLDCELEARVAALLKLAKALGGPATAPGEQEAGFCGSPTSATALNGERAG